MPDTSHTLLRLGLPAVLALMLLATACTPTPPPAPPAIDTPTTGIPSALLESSGDAGHVWIEFPYQGQTLPNEALTFVVYASSAGGVKSINLAINGQGLETGALTDHSMDSSMSLVSVEPGWQPPGEGAYTLSAGSMGANAAIEFCIGACEAAVLQEPGASTPTLTAYITETATPTPWITGSPTPTTFIPDTPTPTETAYSAPETYIELGADPPTIDAGSCTSVYWNTEGFASVTLNSNPVDAFGAVEECLCESKVYTLTGTTGSGTVEDEQVTVTVSGSCLEEADTDPPVIGGASFRWADCSIFGAAAITDPSGVSQAKFHYNLNNEGWHSIWMQDLGDGTWEMEVGVLLSDGMNTPVGSLLYKIEAVDEAGNTTTTAEGEQGYNSCSG